VHTNIPYLIQILSHKEFVMGTMTTRFIETYFSDSLVKKEISSEDQELLQILLKKAQQGLLGSSQKTNNPSSVFSDSSQSPWKTFWRGV